MREDEIPEMRKRVFAFDGRAAVQIWIEAPERMLRPAQQ